MLRLIVAAAGSLVLLLGLAGYFVVLWPLRSPHPTPKPLIGLLAIRGVKIYPSPGAPPLENASVLIRDGLIAEVGTDLYIERNVQTLSCAGCVVTAGFWNTHVHFTEPRWQNANWSGGLTLNAELEEMLTSHGFTTVVDTGSDLRATISLRRRIESGELLGPRIYTAGSSLYPPDGIPYYIRDELPFYARWFFDQPHTPDEAVSAVERNIARGADIVKLFTGSYVARGRVMPMRQPIADAAVDAAHRHGQLVFSHPSNAEGFRVAIQAGVDVLAHAPDTTAQVDAVLLQAAINRKMAMVPTLKMFGTTVTKADDYLQPIYAVVREFRALGGELLFGTDVGYMTSSGTEEEFLALSQCGLDGQAMLRMLTTAPAARFRVAGSVGRIEPGMAADLVVLDGDPMIDVGNFSHVRWTIRNGRILYARP